MNRTVGTCGACGGRVSVPAAWLGAVPPVPTCEACGRQAARPWGPVVEMARTAGEAEAEPVHDNYRERGYFTSGGQGEAGAKGVDLRRPAPAWDYWPRDWADGRRGQGGGGEPGGEGE